MKHISLSPAVAVSLAILLGLGLRLFLVANHEGYLGVDGGAY